MKLTISEYFDNPRVKMGFNIGKHYPVLMISMVSLVFLATFACIFIIIKVVLITLNAFAFVIVNYTGEIAFLEKFAESGKQNRE